MGAKFAPTVASAFMAQWEENAVYKNPPVEFTFYKSYIDDLIIIRNGSKDALENFLAK